MFMKVRSQAWVTFYIKPEHRGLSQWVREYTQVDSISEALDWVDKEYREHGLDPDLAERAGEALRRELETITDAGAQRSWERLAALLRQEKPAKAEEDG
jgi:hypothetical protein